MFAQLHTTSSYAGHVLPGLIVLGLGMGNIFAPGIATATYGVAPTDNGVASAQVNTMQQIGGSIGTALLELHLRQRGELVAEGRPPGPQVAADAAMHGYTAERIGAGSLRACPLTGRR